MPTHDVRVRVTLISTLPIEADTPAAAEALARTKEPYDAAEYFLRFTRKSPRIKLDLAPLKRKVGTRSR